MDNYFMAAGCAAAIMLAIVLICMAASYIRQPFFYPHSRFRLDVSRKRQPQIEDQVDEFLIGGGFDAIQRHEDRVDAWKRGCEARMARSLFKARRRRQYEQALDDSHAYRFDMVRQQTRYRQQNYVKVPYTVEAVCGTFYFSFGQIADRYQKLSAIGFECTLRAYHSKDQRKLATRALRVKVMERDGYTCRICGKYMPDEVGLHVDHILPVSKGGKTVMSNLQVLCSKCNGSKSNKTAGPQDARKQNRYA